MSTYNYAKGDHLVCNIDFTGFTEHHGLYIGAGEVIHLTAEDGKVVQTSLDEFSDGHDIRIKAQATSPAKAIRRAKEKVGDYGYNLISNNCEQFVNYCIKNQKTSNQVSNAEHAAAHTISRYGGFGKGLQQGAMGTMGTITIASTAAKYACEYMEAPESITTVVGAPGDLVAKPLEAIVSGTINTLDNTYDKLSEGEIIDAAEELLVGTYNTIENTITAPFEVAADVVESVLSWFD